MSLRSNFVSQAFSSASLKRFGRVGALDHGREVTAACFDENGNFCATAGGGNVVKVWDVSQELCSPPMLASVPTRHTEEIVCLSFVPNSFNRKIMTSSVDGSVRLHDLDKYDLNRGSELILAESKHTIHKFVFWPGDLNGNIIFIADETGYCRRIDFREAQGRNVTIPHRPHTNDEEEDDDEEDVSFDDGIIYRNFSSFESAIKYRYRRRKEASSSSPHQRVRYRSVSAIACPPPSSPLSPYTIAIGGRGPVVRICDIRALMDYSGLVFLDLADSELNYDVSCASLVPLGLFYNNIKFLDPNLFDVSTIARLDRKQMNSSRRKKRKQSQCHVSVSDLEFSKHSHHLVASYEGDAFYQFNLHPSRSDSAMYNARSAVLSNDYGVEEYSNEDTDRYGVHSEISCYSAHLNLEGFFKSVHYFGPNDEYIVTGSDQAFMMIYDSRSLKLVGMFHADASVCSGVIPHPHLPMLLSYGSEVTVKLWKQLDSDFVDSDGLIVSSPFHKKVKCNFSHCNLEAISITCTSILAECLNHYCQTASINTSSHDFYDRLISHPGHRVLDFSLFGLSADWNRMLIDGKDDDDVSDDDEARNDLPEFQVDYDLGIAYQRRNMMMLGCDKLCNAGTILVNLHRQLRPNGFRQSDVPSSLSSFLEHVNKMKERANKFVADYQKGSKNDFSMLEQAIIAYAELDDLLDNAHAVVVNVRMMHDDDSKTKVSARPFLINGGSIFIYILMVRARRILMNMLNTSRNWKVDMLIKLMAELTDDDVAVVKLDRILDVATRELCELIVSSDYCIVNATTCFQNPLDELAKVRRAVSRWLSQLALKAKTPMPNDDAEDITHEAAVSGIQFHWIMTQLNSNEYNERSNDSIVHDVSNADDFRNVIMTAIPHVVAACCGQVFDRNAGRKFNRKSLKIMHDNDKDKNVSSGGDEGEEKTRLDLLLPLPSIIRRLSIVLNFDSIHLHHELKEDDSNKDAKPAINLNFAIEDDVSAADYAAQVMKLHVIVNSNMSLCYLMIAEVRGSGASFTFSRAKEVALKALTLDSTDVKSTYRLGRAQLGLGEFREAVTILKLALDLKPGDESIKSKLVEARNNLWQSERAAEEKRTFGLTFNNL